MRSGGMLAQGQARSHKHGNAPLHREKQVHCSPSLKSGGFLTKAECFEITVFLLDTIIIKYIWAMGFNTVWRKRRKYVRRCSVFAEASFLEETKLKRRISDLNIAYTWYV